MTDNDTAPHIVLFEDEGVAGLAPLVSWRTVFELRVGRKIILDRTAQRLHAPIAGVWVRESMAAVAAHRCGTSVNQPISAGTVLANGRWMPEGPVDFPKGPCVGLTPVAADASGRSATVQPAYIVCDERLAAALPPEVMLSADNLKAALEGVPTHEAGGAMICYPWDIISRLERELEENWSASDAGVESASAERARLRHTERIHVGLHTTIDDTAVIDAERGPVFISDHVRVGPHAVIEGPCYVGPGSKVNPHAWLHGANAIGPVCKVGGEVDGCVFQGHSNKQHYGFLGHSYVGCWVNLGAGTVNSDLKNTYGTVRVPLGGESVDTGTLFFGAVIADHVKTAINTTIPTGAVLGFASTIAMSGLCPKDVRAFSWLTDDRKAAGDPERLLAIAQKMMKRRDVVMTEAERALFLGLVKTTVS